MKFFDRSREFVYFSDMDNTVRTTHHYDVFMLGTDELDHSAAHVGTFDSKKYAELFLTVPDMYGGLNDAFRTLAENSDNLESMYCAGRINELLTHINKILDMPEDYDNA